MFDLKPALVRAITRRQARSRAKARILARLDVDLARKRLAGTKPAGETILI